MRIAAPNNLTLLRNACAAAVLLGHFLYLDVDPERLAGQTGFPWADLGVQCFFVISGLLVTASYLQARNIRDYALRRLFRVYPLYLAVILGQAAVMSLLLVKAGRWSAEEFAGYVGWNAAFLNFLAPDMGGLFADLHVPAINPSLWTLKLEVLFYAAVPLLCLAVRRFGFPVLAVLILLSTVYFLVFADSRPDLARQLPGQLRFFLVGMAMALAWPRLKAGPWRDRHSAALAAAICLAAAALTYKAGGVGPVMAPLFVGGVVLAFGVWSPVAWPRIPDLSYGVYLFHGPVIQLGRHLGLVDASLGALAGVSLVVLALAWAGQRLVERPAIDAGKRLAAGLRPLARRSPSRPTSSRYILDRLL